MESSVAMTGAKQSQSQPQSGVAEQTAIAGNFTSQLHDRLGELEMRLGGVLEPIRDKTVDGSPISAVQESSPLRDELLNHNGILANACARVQDMIDRLDI